MSVDLEESYYSLDGHEYVKDCDYGVGEVDSYTMTASGHSPYHHVQLCYGNITEDRKRPL